MFWRGLYYVSAFVINILIARHFQASVSGTIYYLSSIYALVLLVSSLSLESGIIYFTARGEIAINKLFNFSLVWSLFIGTVTFGAVYLFYSESYQEISAELILISSVSFIFGNLLMTYCSGFFYARQNFKMPNLIYISGTIVLIALIPYNGRSFIPAINNENYFYVYFCTFLVQGITMAIAAKMNYIKNGVELVLSKTDFKLLFRYCALAFVANLVYFLLYRIDYFFVEKFCTKEQLGNYIQVSKLGHLFFILPTILASAVLPITASGKKENIGQMLTLISRTLFFVYLLTCLVLALAGKQLFPFVFGKSFAEMYEPYLLLIPGILSLSGIFTLTAYYAGTNRIRINITGSVLAVIFILVADVVFVPVYGINAAALISSIGYIIFQVYILFKFKKEFKTTLSDFFIIKFTDVQRIKLVLKSVNKNKNEV